MILEIWKLVVKFGTIFLSLIGAQEMKVLRKLCWKTSV